MSFLQNRIFQFIAATTYFDWGKGAGAKTTDYGLVDIIMYIFNFLSAGVGLVIVIGITYGGIQYSTAAGDKSKTTEAIRTIANCAIALVLYLAMWAVINFLVPGGLFQ